MNGPGNPAGVRWRAGSPASTLGSSFLTPSSGRSSTGTQYMDGPWLGQAQGELEGTTTHMKKLYYSAEVCNVR